jgi:hypothetical protein
MDRLPHFKDDDFRLMFLDIDDVINSVKTSIAHGRYPWPSTTTVGSHTDLNDPPVSDSHAFDQANIKLLDKVCIQTNTHIVLSSSWRVGLDANQCRDMLESIGFTPEYVIGRTCSGKLNWDRGDEIEYFLGELREGSDALLEQGLIFHELVGKSLVPKSYVIIDDRDDMLESQKNNFVHVAPYNGLTLQDAVQACRILLKDDSFLHYSLIK